MKKNLRGKLCLITGAASGIGRATALAAARRGAQLVLTDRDAERLETVVHELRVAGGTVRHHAAFDIADFDAVTAFARDVHDEVGSLDVVMNVAGISVWGSVDQLEHRHWRKAVEVDLMGPIHVIECFVPRMIHAGRGGHLVNVSSAAGLFGLPWHAAYSAAKFGLRGVSEVLRFDLERHGIDVSLVCPGGVDTPLVGSVEIVGVDRTSPAMRRMTDHFKSRAVTSEQAAEAILRGIERRDYLVFTSNDIRVGYWVQNKLAFLYERYMRKLNDQFHRVTTRAAVSPLAEEREGAERQKPQHARAEPVEHT